MKVGLGSFCGSSQILTSPDNPRFLPLLFARAQSRQCRRNVSSLGSLGRYREFGVGLVVVGSL